MKTELEWILVDNNGQVSYLGTYGQLGGLGMLLTRMYAQSGIKFDWDLFPVGA